MYKGRHREPKRSHLRGLWVFTGEALLVGGLAVGGLFASVNTKAESVVAFTDRPVVKVVPNTPAVVAQERPVVNDLPSKALGFTATAKPKAKPRPKARPVATPSHTNSAPKTSGNTVSAAPPISGDKAAQVLAIAASLAGIYYVWGGTTTAGFDCSGFTQYVYRKVGVSLPRIAEDQRRFARPVSSPRPGDLVFFGVPAGHVGIYAGNGMMWDSPRTGKAVALRSIWSSNVSYGRVL